MMDIDQALSDLKELRNLDKASIKESEFTRYLMPILYNQAGIENLDQTYWLDIAGNPHRPIDVLSDKTGEVLFTIPPLMSRLSTINYTKESLPPGGFATIANTYEDLLRSPGNEANADVYLTKSFSYEVFQLDKDKKVIAEQALKEWVKIYTRYKIPLERLFNGVSPTKVGENEKVQQTKPPVDDEYEFEDF